MAVDKDPKIPGRKLPSKEGPVGLEFLSPYEQEAYTSLYLDSYQSHRIRPENFPGIDQAQLMNDEQYVRELEAKYAKEATTNPREAIFQRRGELLEAILWKGIEENGWFGKDAESIVPSRYDDIRNGIDQIVRFIKEIEVEGTTESQTQLLALSVDVTSSEMGIERKIQRIKGSILNKQLTEIRYYRDTDTDLPIEKKHIPRVVIGVDESTLSNLATLEARLIRISNALKEGEIRKESLLPTKGEVMVSLANHLAQIIILEQVVMQLDRFSQFAMEYSRKAEQDEIDSSLSTVREVLENKKKELNITKEQMDIVMSDKITQAIALTLDRFDTI